MSKTFIGPALATLLVTWIGIGCASTPKVDWDSRVGHYTFQDAQKELGEPKQVLRFNDGTRVAEWIVGRSSPPPAVSSSSPGGYGPRRTWGDREGMESLTRAPQFDQYLHLTFSADDRLVKWEEGTK
jgi:hypothetical protein